ncbi:MAG: hypothetical protein KKE17_14400, partial [Proteobacteria bacterium]|nr:hypothetical protein [Pseudomonadota bacterium]MBU1711192.1 hypothetical protein [Pseudomonadota bacterium]
LLRKTKKKQTRLMQQFVKFCQLILPTFCSAKTLFTCIQRLNSAVAPPELAASAPPTFTPSAEVICYVLVIIN